MDVTRPIDESVPLTNINCSAAIGPFWGQFGSREGLREPVAGLGTPNYLFPSFFLFTTIFRRNKYI